MNLKAAFKACDVHGCVPDELKDVLLCYTVKPGISDLAHVHGFWGITDTPDKTQRRVECDICYRDNPPLWSDIKIIFMILFSGFVNRNAY